MGKTIFSEVTDKNYGSPEQWALQSEKARIKYVEWLSTGIVPKLTSVQEVEWFDYPMECYQPTGKWIYSMIDPRL
ncbi:MAG: hypothetical protein A3J54_02920 [Candidatus Ryanbacteria bacterium RIFCSPHIGHO2_02_FULL_45_13b]|uniref:Uncharacterized protein n=1 Tax=Candidatus Ryanbacteria bacterium RIFCSPHIGHO2_02_FULL_45_13b TaxID=1802117 RepID=A0A1G2G6Q8_9BACT|nr:MAG: hypothetical protein A3J54_02920 [Candidatus Ryanbacteria bacterium RIFCSPHIGHO2_02_FULL_45_13b]